MFGAALGIIPNSPEALSNYGVVLQQLKRNGCARPAERSVDAIWNRIANLLDAFTPHECANYFRNARYASC